MAGTTSKSDSFARAIAIIFDDPVWRDLCDDFHLSRRQIQIVKCVLVDEHNDKAIADSLHISRHTVHTHFERLYRKLDVSSRSQLVARIFAAYVLKYRRQLAEHRRGRMACRRSDDDEA